MRSMEDTSPRLSPPPKPAVLEVSTPKHTVPEVSIMCDSNSFTWQAPKQDCGTSNTTSQPNTNTNTLRTAPGVQEVPRGTARRPPPPPQHPMQEFIRNVPRAAPSPPVGHGEGYSSPITHPGLLPPHRVILEEREYKGLQNTASPPYSSHSVHPVKQYNPQLYSPLTQRTAKGAVDPQRNCSVGNQVIPTRQFSPASSVPHVGVSQGPRHTLPTASSATRIARQDPINARINTVPSAVQDLQQDRAVGMNGTSPHILPHKSNMQDSPVGDGSSSSSRPRTFPPSTNLAHANTYTPPHPPVSLTNTPRTTTTSLSTPPTSTHHNATVASHSLPHLQQARLPTHHPGLYENRNWSSPASCSLPVPSTTPYIPQGPDYPLGQPWGHPDTHYSPVFPAARLPHSPADPVVYGLIEDQKQQILKLTLDLQKIIERQAKEEEKQDRDTPKTNHRTRMKQRQDLHQDAATQTQDSEQPPVQNVGVNTDISWPDLIASLRHHKEEEEEEERKAVTHPRHLRVPRQEAWLKGIRGVQEHFPSHPPRRQPRDSSESASETTHGDSQEDVESCSSQEWSEAAPTPPLPTTTARAIHTRVDGGDGWQEGPDGRESGHPSPPPPPPHTGTTFYHNVMTNIQQILQHTSPAQDQQQHHQHQQQHHQHQQHQQPHQQQQQHLQQQQQQQQQQPVTPSLPSTAAARVSGRGGSTPDPQIEAVRQQLVNFGISFLDPATLTHNNRPLVDSLYLPGLHNAVSLYQSSISTHIHHASDATAAKYLTDSQLAAIAAASPAMKKTSGGSTDQPGPALPPSLPPTHQHHRLYFHGEEDENSNCVSMTTKKFLEKYGVQDD